MYIYSFDENQDLSLKIILTLKLNLVMFAFAYGCTVITKRHLQLMFNIFFRKKHNRTL